MKSIPQELITGNRDYFYWVYEPEEFNKTIIYFPSGSASGQLMDTFNERLFPKTRWIGIDYPGRGMMQYIKDKNQISQIAEYCTKLITLLDINNPIFLAHSFGTSIAIETLRYNNNLAKLIILIQAGEFIGTGLHQFVNYVFKQSLDNESAQHAYQVAMEKVNEVKPFFDFDGFDTNCINKQLLAINNFKLDTKLTTTVKTLLIHSKKDELVRRNSRKKLKDIFVNRKELMINRRHTFNSSSHLSDFQREMLPLAADWISKHARFST